MSSRAVIPFRPEPIPAEGPRVLFVIPGDGQGSSMIFARRQALSLASAGVPTDLFHLSSRTSPYQIVREVLRFRAELARLRPAIVHAQFGTVTALFAALASGSLPLVITYRGGDLNSPPRSYRFLARIQSALGRIFSQMAALRAQKIICVSQRLRENLWWRRDAAAVLPSGVDPEVFRPEPRFLARQRLGWDDQERVVLFNAGHDAHVKRLDLARASVDRARRNVPGLRLEVLYGNVEPELLPVMMNAADCLLLTSVSEGSPTVVQEALACDLPIVAVDVGDIVERLRGVRDSAVVAGDSVSLSRALVRIVEPPRRSNGSLKVSEFSSRLIAREVKQIYLELTGA